MRTSPPRVPLSLLATTLAAVVAVVAAPSTLPAQRIWQQTSPPNAGPTRGLWPGMAFALSTGRCYLYGGAGGGTTSNETWEYDGANANWTQLFPTNDPGERHTFGICYDSVRDVIVMFGGSDNNYTPNGETWEYSPSANTWTNVTPAAGPSPQPRYGCHMAFDVVRGVAVLYGGWSGAGFTNETWEWDGASWTQITTANIPTGRDRFGFCYDLQRSRCVLFGGITAAGASDETWEYDGLDWTLVATPTSPPPRQKCRLAYDPARGVAVLQGGQANAVQLLDCWEFDGSNWRLVPSTPSPARGEHAVAFDVARGTAVVFGGYAFGTYTDTWEYALATTPTFVPFGVGCFGAGGVPSLQPAAGSTPAIGGALTLEVSNLPPGGGVGAVFYGGSNYAFGPLWLPLDLGLLGWNGCRAYVTPDVGVTISHTAGTATTMLPIPTNPALQQFTLYAQAISLDATTSNGQVALSNAGEIIVN